MEGRTLTVNIPVTAEDGTTKVYKLIIKCTSRQCKLIKCKSQWKSSKCSTCKQIWNTSKQKWHIIWTICNTRRRKSKSPNRKQYRSYRNSQCNNSKRHRRSTSKNKSNSTRRNNTRIHTNSYKSIRWLQISNFKSRWRNTWNRCRWKISYNKEILNIICKYRRNSK